MQRELPAGTAASLRSAGAGHVNGRAGRLRSAFTGCLPLKSRGGGGRRLCLLRRRRVQSRDHSGRRGTPEWAPAVQGLSGGRGQSEVSGASLCRPSLQGTRNEGSPLCSKPGEGVGRVGLSLQVCGRMSFGAGKSCEAFFPACVWHRQLYVRMCLVCMSGYLVCMSVSLRPRVHVSACGREELLSPGEKARICLVTG